MVVGYEIPKPSSCVPSKNSTIAAQTITRIREKQSKQADQISHSSECIASKYGLEQKSPPEQFPAAFGPSLPTVDNLRNF
jgi:hypothetical protein